jgi:hypothetical protein
MIWCTEIPGVKTREVFVRDTPEDPMTIAKVIVVDTRTLAVRFNPITTVGDGPPAPMRTAIRAVSIGALTRDLASFGITIVITMENTIRTTVDSPIGITPVVRMTVDSRVAVSILETNTHADFAVDPILTETNKFGTRNEG